MENIMYTYAWKHTETFHGYPMEKYAQPPENNPSVDRVRLDHYECTPYRLFKGNALVAIGKIHGAFVGWEPVEESDGGADSAEIYCTKEKVWRKVENE
tara:strand:- start:806 stop:1099 length:294 start_codon:yes stop_codon:yes gene_type:complete